MSNSYHLTAHSLSGSRERWRFVGNLLILANEYAVIRTTSLVVAPLRPGETPRKSLTPWQNENHGAQQRAPSQDHRREQKSRRAKEFHMPARTVTLTQRSPHVRRLGHNLSSGKGNCPRLTSTTHLFLPSSSGTGRISRARKAKNSSPIFLRRLLLKWPRLPRSS